MDLDRDGARQEAERLGGRLVVDLRHAVHLEEVVAAPQRADLVGAAEPGARRHGPGIGGGEPAALLAALDVVRRGREAAPRRPARPLREHLVELGVGERGDGVARADAGGDVAVELGGDRVPARADHLRVERGRHEAHAAVDVVADAARRHGPALRVHRGDAADGEAVAPVDVGHREREAEDAGEVRDVRDLLQGRVVGRRRADGVHAAGHLHAPLARDLPEVALDVPQLHRRIPPRPQRRR